MNEFIPRRTDGQPRYLVCVCVKSVSTACTSKAKKNNSYLHVPYLLRVTMTAPARSMPPADRISMSEEKVSLIVCYDMNYDKQSRTGTSCLPGVWKS